MNKLLSLFGIGRTKGGKWYSLYTGETVRSIVRNALERRFR